MNEHSPKKSRWIAGNWKMNHGIAATQAFFTELQKECHDLSSLFQSQEILLFPPYTSLAEAQKLAKTSPFPISIGAQNAHFEMKGAFTGEISGDLLKELGIGHVLVGHSERRHVIGESNAVIAKKTSSLLEQGFRVLLCVGETDKERKDEQTLTVLRTQLQHLKGLPLDRVLIAYEPVWAIGTGIAAEPSQASEAHSFIKEELQCDLPVLYGGSVTSENFSAFMKAKDVDGALIGGASLKAKTFATFLRN